MCVPHLRILMKYESINRDVTRCAVNSSILH